jgi:hypothetical protein
MIKFETQKLGKVVIKFRHFLPEVRIADTNVNSLVSLADKLQFLRGETHCTLQLNVGYMEEHPTLPEVEFFGKAFTHPVDNYKKETGRVLSLTRALEEAVSTHTIITESAREVMSGYYSRGKSFLIEPLDEQAVANLINKNG